MENTTYPTQMINTVKEAITPPELTDRQVDTNIINSLYDNKTSENTWDDVYNLPEYKDYSKGKLVGYAARSYKFEYPNDTDEQRATRAGATPEMLKRLTSGNYDDFSTGVATSVGAMAVGANKLTNNLVGFNSDAQVDAVSNKLQSFEDNRDFMQMATAEYDDDGARNIDRQQMETLGELAPASAIGTAIGGAAATKAGMLTADAFFSGLDSTLYEFGKAGSHNITDAVGSKVGTAGVVIASSIIGNLLFGTTAYKGALTGEGADQIAKGLRFMEGLDLPITEAMIRNPGKVKDIIAGQMKNPFLADSVKEGLVDINSKTILGIRKTLNSIGTNPIQYMKYKNGTIPLSKMGQVFKDAVEGEAMGIQATVNSTRKTMSKSDVDEAGKELVYKLGEKTQEGKYTGFLGELLDTAGDNATVYNFVKRQITHRGRVESAQSVATADVVARHADVSARLKGNMNKIELIKAQIPIDQANIGKLTPKLNEAREAYMTARKNKKSAEVVEGLKIAYDGLVGRVKKLNTKIASNTSLGKELSKSNKLDKSELGNALNEYRKLEILPGETAQSLVENPTEFTANDMDSFIKAVNDKLNIAGGAISTEDKTQMHLLRQLKTKMNDHMDATVQSSSFKELRKEANALTLKKYNLTTDQGGVIGIKKALKSSDPRDMALLFKDEHAMHNLKTFKGLVKESPELKGKFDEMLNVTLKEKIMKGVDLNGLDNGGVDYKQLQDNLGDPDFIADLKGILPPEVVENIEAVKGFVDRYGETFQTLQNNMPQGNDVAQGMGAKIKEFVELMFKAPKYAIETVGGQISKLPYDKAMKMAGSQKRMYWFDERLRLGDAVKEFDAIAASSMTDAAKREAFNETLSGVTSRVKNLTGKVEKAAVKVKAGFGRLNRKDK